MKRGNYFVIEGGEGCGKTTQAEMLYNFLKEKNVPCYLGREPGGIKSAEEMRNILKHNKEDISPIGELFGFEFARAEYFDKVVIPKLNEGITVISDRSGYSTLAYQGYGGGVDLEQIVLMNKIATRNIEPDVAFIIDINPEEGLAKELVKDNRFSEKGLEYHKRVRQGYLDIANENENENCVLVKYIPDGAEEMQSQIRWIISLID
jgi:dTMP kinase